MAYLPDELVASGHYKPDEIGGLVSELLMNCRSRKAATDPVLTAWGQVVPPGLARHCRVKNVSGNRLEVWVDSPAYLYEMQLCQSEILQSVQALCPRPRIRSIKLTLG